MSDAALESYGLNGLNETCMALHVPDEHCEPGLEVKVVIASNGIYIGGELLPWPDIEAAKLQARGCKL